MTRSDGTDTCPTPHKSRFATIPAAESAASRQQLAVGSHLVPYACPCGWVHLTKERTTAAEPTTADTLFSLPPQEFTAHVRDDVTGRAHPETSQALRSPKLLDRWWDALGVFEYELGAQRAARPPDGTAETEQWRARTARVLVSIKERRAEVRHLRDQVGGSQSSIHGLPLPDGSFSSKELRTIAGERALTRLKAAHATDFCTFLKEEYDKLGVTPGKTLRKAFTSHLPTTNDQTGNDQHHTTEDI